MTSDGESRRRFLRQGALIATLGLAGCSGDDGGPTPTSSQSSTTPTTMNSTVSTGTTPPGETHSPTSTTSIPADTTTEEPTPSDTPTPTETGPPDQSFGIDCGGVHTADTVTIDGLSFLPEAAFTQDLDIEGTNMVGGLPENARWWTENGAMDIDPAPNAGIFDTEIDGTDYDDLYRTEHWYGPTDGRYDDDNPLTYTVSLQNGSYDVTLHFAEVWFGGPKEGGAGKKVFTVEINGEPVLEEFDIYAEVGYATALTKTFEIEVTDGELAITAIPIVHNPRFNAIEIHEV